MVMPLSSGSLNDLRAACEKSQIWATAGQRLVVLEALEGSEELTLCARQFGSLQALFWATIMRRLPKFPLARLFEEWAESSAKPQMDLGLRLWSTHVKHVRHRCG